MAKADEARKSSATLPSYRQLASDLRSEIDTGVYAPGEKMPTEVDLQARYNVSRHTVREALQQLLSDGLIYRVQGSGTYVSGRQGSQGRYLRSIGSLEEIIVWPDTKIEVIEPFHIEVDPSVASRLELGYIEVSKAILRRSYDGVPFVLTRHYVSPDLGQKLAAAGIPSRGEGTVIGEAESLLPRRIAGARQDITAMNAPADEAEMIGCEQGDAILLIERLYYDTAGTFVEFTASHFNPRRYSYRMELRRRSE